MQTQSDRPPLRPATIALLLTLLMIGAIVCATAGVRHAGRDLTLRDPAYRLDVNVADRGRLQILPRIGPGTADHIVQHRHTHGPFRSPADLDRVRMIGPVTLERLEPLITFGNP